jgi:hypothetical protein
VIIATIKASLGNALIKEIHDSGNFAAQHNALLCLSRVTPPHCLIRAVTRRNRCLAWNVTVAMLVSVQDFS